MRKGISGLAISLLLVGMTLLLGIELPKVILDSEKQCSHTMAILLFDKESGLRWDISDQIERNNVTKYTRFADADYFDSTHMFAQKKEILFVRNDGETHYGSITDSDLRKFLGCK